MTTSMFRSVIIIPLKGGFAFDLLLYEIVQGNMITEPLGSLFPLLISNHNASSPSGIKSMLQLLRMVPIGHDCVSWRTRTRLQRLRCGTSGRRERGFCPCKLLKQCCSLRLFQDMECSLIHRRNINARMICSLPATRTSTATARTLPSGNQM